jgi:hypothetical protein
VGNLYLSSVPVTSGLFSTQYFGSAHTGNVLQTHGLKLSVPNVNNSALIAGYDVNWDAAYINSADQNSVNSLALNTTGGFVGVGKIAPVATLDVSGNATISGDLTIGGITNFASNVSFNTVSITSTVNSTSTTTGAITIAGGAGIGGNVFLRGNLITGGDLSCNGNIIVGTTTTSTSTTTGALIIAGGAGIRGNIFTGGNLYIGSTTNSTSTTTGALRVVGGAGIQGNLNIGGFSTHVFDASFNGNIQLTQTNNPLWFVANNAQAFNPTLATSLHDVGIFYGYTNPSAAGLVISPRGTSTSGGIKMDLRGNVGIGVSNPAYTLDVTGSIRATTFLNVGAPSPPTNTTGNISASGQISALSFNATSDYRMKQNTQPLLITRTIDLLKPVEYDLSGGSHDMGFLAHEVQEVLPFLVSGERDGPYMQSMNYNGFIALLVKEVQDLKKENRELKERMDRLEKYFM